MARPQTTGRFLLCLSAGEYPASLEPRKVYRALPDADAERRGYVRVVDESGEDYLYPRGLFVEIELPREAAAAFRSASGGATYTTGGPS